MSYKLLSFIQSIFIIILGVSFLDSALSIYNEDFGFNDMLFDSPDTWWNDVIFRAYCILVAGILQFLKAISAED